MVEKDPLSFEVIIQEKLAMRIHMDHRLSIREVMDCLHTLEESLNAAQREGFQDTGVFERHIDGRAIQIVRM